MGLKVYIHCLALALFCCFVHCAYARELSPLNSNETPMESVYVIGILGDDINPHFPASAIVIEREQLEQFGNASLATVLDQLPGAIVDQNAGRGSFNSLYLRGADPNFTQIRIDGVVVNNSSNSRGGAFDLSNISARIIERIEIVADASSAIYGSQALAGIINIVTRSSGYEAAIELDSHGGETASIFLATGTRTLSVVHERPKSPVSGSDFASDELGLKQNWMWRDRHQLQFIGRIQRYEKAGYPDDSGGSRFAANRERERRTGDILHASAHYEYASLSNTQFDFNASYFEQQEQQHTPAVQPGVRDPFGLPGIMGDADFERVNIEARYTVVMSNKSLWRSALNWERESAEQTSELDFSVFQLPTSYRLSRDIISLSQSLELFVNNQLKLTVAGRLDKTREKSIFSPRISLLYNFDDGLNLVYMTLGKGFKLASLYALADPLIGNSQLLDESAKSILLGHKFASGLWKIEHSVYHYSFKNLIDFDSGPPPSLVNRDAVKINGLESVLSYYPGSDWQLDLFQMINHINVSGSGVTLRQRPRYRAGIRVDYNATKDLGIWLKHRFVGERFDSSIATGDTTLDSYYVTDAGTQWRINKHWYLTAQWRNMFSKHYSLSVGNEIAKSSFYLQMSYRGK